MKPSGMKKLLALALALVMCLSLLPAAALASGDAPAMSLVEGGMPLPAPAEEAPEAEEAPVTDAAAEETAAEEMLVPEEPGREEPVRISWINPLYADWVTLEDITRDGSVALDGASPSFSTVAAAAAYIRQQMVARNEEIVFVFSGDVNTAIAAAMTHTGNPKEGDSIAYQLGGWDGEVYSDGTVVLWPMYYTTANQEAALDAEVEGLLSELDLPRASDYETVKVIHDYLCDTVTYNTTGDDTPWTTYGALVQQICVCQGYSLAMYRLLLECGIDCRIISGDGGGPHAWNIVKLGEYYYSVDATWDGDGGYGGSDYYLLRGKTAFYQDHTPEEGPFEDYSWSSPFWDEYPLSLADYDPENPGGTGSGEDEEEEPSGIPITAATFPDTNLRTYVAKNLDINLNGWLSDGEIEAVTALDVSGLGILDMTGVGIFTELQALECYDNYIAKLDVSNFLYLEYLDVSGNGMESLTLGTQNNLYALYCENNSLTKLDVSGCPELWFMWCHNNALEELRLGGCPALVELSCYDNYIEYLDVSPCDVLAALVETIEPEYYYDYGIVDYYYQADTDLYFDLMTDIGVMLRTRERRGDVNGDGYVNAADAALVLRHTVGMGTLTGDAALQADTNFDEVIDVRDAAQILRFENSLTTIIQ